LSSIRPAERSASIAICLPGIASRVKRAPTSAIRVAPLVMTRKLTVIRMAKTMSPITKSPLITNRAKPPITSPAAVTPSPPWDRMSRVVAMLSDRRSSVATSRTVGNDENSSGFSIQSATMRISTESAIESASPRSMRSEGIGRKNTQRIRMIPSAKAISRRPCGAPVVGFARLAVVIGCSGPPHARRASLRRSGGPITSPRGTRFDAGAAEPEGGFRGSVNPFLARSACYGQELSRPRRSPPHA
jgi:hypothetical protein